METIYQLFGTILFLFLSAVLVCRRYGSTCWA